MLHEESTTNEIAEEIKLSPSRVGAILSEMENIEKIGSNTNRRYKIKETNAEDIKS